MAWFMARGLGNLRDLEALSALWFQVCQCEVAQQSYWGWEKWTQPKLRHSEQTGDPWPVSGKSPKEEEAKQGPLECPQQDEGPAKPTEKETKPYR